jgi:hypothetical protein
VISEACARAELRGWARPVAVQAGYSLAWRDKQARGYFTSGHQRLRSYTKGISRRAATLKASQNASLEMTREKSSRKKVG